MRVLGFDAPGGRTGAWAVVDDATRRGLVLRDVGNVTWTDRTSEQEQYRALWDLLDRLAPLDGVLDMRSISMIVIEAPFLYRIAQPVGGVKMWAAVRRVPHVMLGSSSARKLVLGSGGPGKAAKAVVLAAMVGRFGARRITNQHRADAALYALAGHAWIEKNGWAK